MPLDYTLLMGPPDEGKTPPSKPVPTRRQQPGQPRPHQEARAKDPGVWEQIKNNFKYFYQWSEDAERLFIKGGTFGFSDRWTAYVYSKFNGNTYAKELKKQEADTNAARARQSVNVKIPFTKTNVDIAPVEFAGGATGIAGQIGAGARSIKALVAAGGVDGFLTGMGYSDKVELSDAAVDGLKMVPFGMAGGAVVGAGVKTFDVWKAAKVAKAADAAKAAESAAQSVADSAATQVAKAAQKAPETPPVSPVKVANEADAGVTTMAQKVELDGEDLFDAALIKENPAEAVAAARRRINQMSDDEAEAFAARIAKAEAEGDPTAPHYRSILNADISDIADKPERFIQSVNAAEDIYEDLLDRVAKRKVDTGQVEKDVADMVKRGITDTEALKLIETMDDAVRATRAGKIMSIRGGKGMVEALQKFEAATKAGTEGAKETFRKELNDALHTYAYGTAISSRAGTALQQLQPATRIKLDKDVAETFGDLGLDNLKTRIDDALNNMEDTEIASLIKKMRSGADADKVVDILLNKDKARSYSLWQRTIGTVESFLKSNALTPATAIFNSVTGLAHDFFRSNLTKRWAAFRSVDEIEALGLKLERELSQSVYWEAQKLGLKAALDRTKFEFYEGLERVAGAAGDLNYARALRDAKQTIADSGNMNTMIREVKAADPARRLGVADYEDFAKKLNGLDQYGPLGELWAMAQRAGGAATNALDVAGGMSGKFFTALPDEWQRNFIMMKEGYAFAVRSAVKEAREAGIPIEQMPEWIKTRAMEKVNFPDDQMWNAIENRLLAGEALDGAEADFVKRQAAIEQEAEETLFLDGPQTEIGRVSTLFLQTLDPTGIIFPYIRTPIRLLERGLIDYTPLGYLAKSTRETIAKGGTEALLAKARIELGTMAVGMGFALGAGGFAISTNGGYANTKNLDGVPPNSFKVGGYHFEFGRLDPFATSIGLGVMLGQAVKEGHEDGAQYDAAQKWKTAFSVAVMGSMDTVLSKSYLTGLRDFVELFSDKAPNKAERIAGSVASRLIPFSGTSRQVTDTFRQNQPESVSIMDQIIRSVPGGGYSLPDKLNLLGDPVEGRDLGIAAGKIDKKDPITQKLIDLEIDLTDVRKTDPKGFRLTAKQLSDLRYIRGHIATNSDGLTMKEALGELFDSEDFVLAESKARKQDLVSQVISEFNKPARELMEMQDGDYLKKREAARQFDKMIEEGAGLQEAEDFQDYMLNGPDN